MRIENYDGGLTMNKRWAKTAARRRDNYNNKRLSFIATLTPTPTSTSIRDDEHDADNVAHSLFNTLFFVCQK